ncbi:MAG: hypothetical protein M3R35_07400, partial [Candidatus Eremiobacteraeota bacterium]|nr:hypothetical protein [Candidatus Eremiobacteraeota bacterium]
PASASRTMLEVADETHVASARRVRAAIAVLAATADARMLGIAPVEPLAVRAAAAEADIERFLRTCGPADPQTTRAELAILADNL